MALKKELCPMCEKACLKLEKEEFKMYGISLGFFEAEKCPKCGEIFFDEKNSDKMDEKAKQMGLWGLNMETKVTRSGNSLAIRVSKKIADFLELKNGGEVRLHPENKHRLIIEV
ncbi:MAG: hypothetical protein V1911_02925 [Candidatus Micrarchaeota archaeon]